MSLERIDPAGLYDALLDGAELALIDVREEGIYGARHILRAVNIPLSRLELDFPRLVPRRSVRLVLVDDGDGLAERANEVLNLCATCQCAALDGGMDAWEAAGYEVFSGLNVPSKVFGEYVEHAFDTPHLTAEALKRKMDDGTDMVILDSRPMDEFNAMNIPGGIDCPGAELVYRVKDIALSPDTTVVVNCAGRTRSIIGAQSLRNAGLENPVYCLKDGTMGWHLAGLELERGATRAAAVPSAKASAWARKAASRVVDRFGVSRVDWETVMGWLAEPDRTTFLLDVRDAEAFEAGHIPGAVHAPGGQLVQATDEYVGVLNARLVLMDDEEVRAPMSASWLVQMGWRDVYVLAGGIGDRGTETGPVEVRVPELEMLTATLVDPRDLSKYPDAPIVDFSPSQKHRAGHIKGARYAIRARVHQDLKPIFNSRLMIFVAEDERIAHLACHDLTRAGIHRIRVLKGGMPGWRAVGGVVETGLENPLSEPADCYYRPYDREHGVEQAMQAYLDWEVALVQQLERDRTLRFPDFTGT